MIYLLDSNAVRDLMDEHPRVVARATLIASSATVAANTIVRGEVLFGIERLPMGKRRDRLAATAAAVFSQLAQQPIPFDAGAVYARVKRERERAGVPMDENDLWIAATALVTAAVVVTRDRDFQSVAGLSVEDWTV